MIFPGNNKYVLLYMYCYQKELLSKSCKNRLGFKNKRHLKFFESFFDYLRNIENSNQ